MPTITDWLMVIITFVYVVATIFICVANRNVARATKEELAEMKKQYAEENRAHLGIEFCYERRTWYLLRIVNHGKLTAQHVKIKLDEAFIESLPEQSFRDILLKENGRERIIGVGQYYDLYIGSNELRGNPNMKPITGKISYQDETKSHESDISIDLDNYATFFSSTYDEPMVKEIKEIKKEISGIKSSVASIDASTKIRAKANTEKKKCRIKYR